MQNKEILFSEKLIKNFMLKKRTSMEDKKSFFFEFSFVLSPLEDICCFNHITRYSSSENKTDFMELHLR